MAILKIRDADGNVQEILALRGKKGDPGEFTGGELLNAHINNKNNPHGETAEQIGARPDTWMPTAADVGARPDTWMPTAADVGARPDTWMPTAADVGAAPAGHGLGGGISDVSLTELDSKKTCGWYLVDPGEAQDTCGIWWRYAVCSVIGNGDACVQELMPIYSSIKLMRYVLMDKTWSDWVLVSTYFSYSNGTLTITTGENAGE